MERTIHFHEHDDGTDGIIHGWAETETAIKAGQAEIHTTQMGLMGTERILEGYRVFVHPDRDAVYEIRLGGDNTCTMREIRVAHNLFRMWLGGEFQIS